MTVIAVPLFIAGCTAAPDEGAKGEASESGGSGPSTPDASGSFSLSAISSCDTVEAVVEPFIEGLVPSDLNEVTPEGAYCSWESPEDAAIENIRNVIVDIEPVHEGDGRPDAVALTEMLGGEILEDAWVSGNDGVAYTSQADTAIAAITTTVWFPDIEVTVGGGAWGTTAPLDGPAALSVARTLLSR